MERLVTEAIVLRTASCGEADRIVTLFSRDLGRVSAFAAHARKSRRRFAGALDPFTSVRAALVERRGDVWRLDSTEIVDAVPEIRRDLALVARAGYAVELVHEICRDREPHPDLYASLSRFLAHLARSETTPADLLRFELEALAAVGVSPHLANCASCGARPGPGDGFDAARGGVVCMRCARHPMAPINAGVRLLADLADPPASPVSSDARSRAQAREALEEFLQYHLGVRLRSARFMVEVGVE